jgi:hypothetical protein
MADKTLEELLYGEDGTVSPKETIKDGTDPFEARRIEERNAIRDSIAGARPGGTLAEKDRDRRQLEAFKLVRQVVTDEVSGNLFLEGATLTSEDREAIRARVRKAVGAKGSVAAELDSLTNSVLSSMTSGDRAKALHTTKEGSAKVGNLLGESPLWEVPEAEAGSDMDPGDLAERIARR